MFIYIGSCAEKEFDPNNPEKSFLIAREPYDDENYEIALTRLGEFKARFPYSKYAVEAELLIANSQFESEHFTEAASAYAQFAKLHPKHPQVEFAKFRVGESYWSDAPDDIDREQEYTGKAVAEWEKLIEASPKSEFATKAREFMKIGKRRIAESEEFVAKFYCKQQIWHACAFQTIKVADKYTEFRDIQTRTVKLAVKALRKLAVEKQAVPDSDKNLYFKTLTSDELEKKAATLQARLEALSKPS
jgi:outer membrane protein assembly factor BamD